MMSDELKSAVELALERLNRDFGDAAPELNEEQKRKIAEIRATFRARIAEAEISFQSKLKQARLQNDFEATEKAQHRLVEERKKLEKQMEKEVDRVRSGK